ncbi:MAG: methyltransferase domain-containing protein [Actinomycetota bacterium]
MSETTEPFHLPLEAARAYEATFVPAIFAEWAPHTLAAARPRRGDRILDVACGTGIVARTAVDLVGPDGAVTGLDLNDAMLTVAAEIEDRVAWRQGDVADLPFADQRFDAATCQMALMFFPDRTAAFRELRRVVVPHGRIAISVPGSLDDQPAYLPFVEAVARHAGDDATAMLSTYWNCGDLDVVAADATAAGLVVAERRTRAGVCGFASPADFVHIEVNASPLADRIDAEALEAIVADVDRALGPTTRDEFSVPLVGHVLSLERADQA